MCVDASGAQQLGEPTAGAMQPYRESGGTASDDPRGIANVKAFPSDQLQAFLVSRAQLGKATEHFVAGAQRRRVVGLDQPDPRRERRPQMTIEPDVASTRPHGVRHHPAGDGEQPGELFVVRHFGHATPGDEERLGDDVSRRVAHATPRVVVNHAHMPAIQGGVPLRVLRGTPPRIVCVAAHAQEMSRIAALLQPIERISGGIDAAGCSGCAAARLRDDEV